MVVGFLGGRDAWNDGEKGVRQVAFVFVIRPPSLYETFENRSRDVAEDFVIQAFDGFGDESSNRPTLIVYGQSFGGAATVKFARQLETLEIPIL